MPEQRSALLDVDGSGAAPGAGTAKPQSAPPARDSRSLTRAALLEIALTIVAALSVLLLMAAIVAHAS